MGRAFAIALSHAVAALTVCAQAAAEALPPTRVVLTEIRAGVEIKALEGPFGRMIDINLTEQAPDEVDLEVRVGTLEINDAVQLSPPSVETVYAFTGVDQGDVCAKKLQLDTFLALSGQPNLAYSDQANELCESLGVAWPLSAWREDYAIDKGYRRVLVVHVSANGDVPFPYADDPVVWAHADLPLGIFDDEETLLREVGGFAAANSSGLWALAPAETVPLSAPLTVSFLNDGALLWSFDLEGSAASGRSVTLVPPFLGEAALAYLGLAVAVLLGLVALLWWLLVRLRKKAPGTPLRALSIGYGAHQNYRLGEGEERDVALVLVYDSGRMRIVRKSRSDRITVNGKDIKDGAWITGADKVAIGTKRFQFG